VTDHVSTIDEIVSLLDQVERAVSITRGAYKPRKPKAISK
jgi:hypothetical protein